MGKVRGKVREKVRKKVRPFRMALGIFSVNALTVAIGMTGFAANASAQGYPLKNIALVVPYPAGGGTDLFARAIAQDLSRQFDKPVVIDNRSGAGGNIGAEMVARATPDGHTLLYTASQIVVSKVLSKTLRFDPQRDLRPITMTISIPLILVVHPALPVKNVKELVALAKAKPGALTYSSSGPGASGHFTMEMLNAKAGTDLRHVPYRGAAAALTSVIAGETQIAFLVPPLVQAHAAGGKLRIIAVSSPVRSPAFPNVPTMSEQGVSGYAAMQWHGLFAPAATSDAVVNTLHGAVVKALSKPELKSRLAAEGGAVVASSPAAFAAFFQQELATFTDIAKQAKMEPQ